MPSIKDKEVKIFSGNANRPLAEAIANYLDLPLGNMFVSRFPDGEIRVRCLENVRGSDVFIIQPTYAPAENLMELLIMIDALRRASAHTIGAVIPFFGYARQDRKTQSREPISAKLVTNLITVAGATRVIAVDLHAGQIQGFFDIPTDNLTAMITLARYFREKKFEAPVIVAPDVGAVHRATEFAKEIPHSTQAIFVKRRLSPDEVETNKLIGNVNGKTVILVDDAIHTGGTIVSAAREVMRRGAKEVYACATHGIFAGNSLKLIEESPIKELVITDTVLKERKLPDKVKILSVAPLIGEAIKRISLHQSISALFEQNSEK